MKIKRKQTIVSDRQAYLSKLITVCEKNHVFKQCPHYFGW